MKGFLNFIREQGVMGLAVGFLLGGAVSKLVASLISDIINPTLSLILGFAGNFKEAYVSIGGVHFLWGNFVSTMIDLLVIAAIVYYGVKGLGLDRIDRKKEDKPPTKK